MIKKLRLKNVVALIGFHLFLLTSVSVFAQNKTVTGTVTDASTGQTLPGVTIRVKNNTNKVSTTDLNGKYSLSVDAGSTLIFSYIGFVDQSIVIGNQSVISPKLGINTKSLSEVVVIGYGTAKRSDLTGSVSSVNAATIAKVPVVSVDQALQGRAAGVQVTNNDAAPGGNISVLIRGTGSLAQNGNGPLYVVDGYPIETGGINNINPSDIASIDVLKDASSAAIYGIRAANGVVIVTTKKGRKDGVQISFDAYNQFQSRPKTYKLLNAQQFATLANQQEATDPTGQFHSFAAWKDPSSLTNADWQKAIYRTGLTQNYSLALRGGSDKVQSSTSVGYYDQKGIVLGSYFKRISLGLNLDYQPTKWLRSSTSAKYTYQNANNPFTTGAMGLGSIAQLPPTLNGGSNITSQIEDSNGNYGFYNPIYTYTAKYSNPIYTINSNQYANINQYLLTNSSLEATVLQGLKVKTNAGVTISNGNGTYFSPTDNRIFNQYGNAGSATQNAAFSQSQTTTFDWLWENTVAYDRTFGKHAISFVGGVSQQELTTNGYSGSGVPPNNTIKDLAQVNTGTLVLNSTAQVITSLASIFGRLNYTFDDKYILTGTIRRDGSSKFAQGHQYGTFPSGALAWKVKQESFLKDVNWLNDFKLRGSYGISGNQGTIGANQFDALYAAGTAASTNGNYGYPFNKTYQSGIVAIQPANPNLKWETDYQTDLGTDISFLKGDLNFTVDYFNRKSKDFLLYVPVSIQTGFYYETENVGSMNNKGFEFSANYNHTIRDFKFGAALTVSILRNKLTSLENGSTYITNPTDRQGISGSGQIALPGTGWTTYTETNIGQAVGEFYGYKSLGIIQSQAQLNALNAAAKAKGFDYYQQASTAPGDRLYADTNGDGHVTADDQTSLGNPQPKFFGGLNLDGSYKSFDFNFYFYGSFGNKILNYEESNLETYQNRSFAGIQNISQEYYANAWTPTNPSNTYARILYNDNTIGNSLPSSAWIENGSFLKLKTFTVGYTFPTALAHRLSISRLRVYASTQNLFTITKYKGLDPEIGSQGGYATQNGIDAGTYPSSKFYTVGLNVTFQ